MTLQQWLETNDDTDKAGGHISEQWTGIDEAGNSISINAIASGSGKKMLWRCLQGHQWYATVNSRTANKTGCKYCYANQRKLGQHVKAVSEDESLYAWCLNNEYGQTILNEWTGKTVDNTILDIKHTKVQSNKDVYWVCSKNKEHVWHTKIQKRTLLHSGCPYCCGQKASKANSLLQYCKENNLQYLIEEFAGVDENNTKVDMTEVTKASHKKVKWKHTINGVEHEWIASISDRVYKHSMCPYCNSKNTNILGKNDLLTWCKNNGDFGAKVIKAWVGLDENYNKIDISSVSYGSKKKALLQCECGKIFCKEILKLTYSKNILCSKCTHESKENKRYNTLLQSSKTLREWCDNNPVYGTRIKNEFAGVDFEGNPVSMNEITYGSARKVLWRHYTKSGKKHEWYAIVNNRVCNKSMCPICNNKGTSLPEQIIYMCIKQVYKDTISRGKFQGYEFDISIPELKTCIEYGSTYYHDERQERDEEKQKLCEKYNVNFIKIIEDSTRELDEVWGSNLIVTRIEFNRIRSIEKIIKHLCKILKINYSDINFKAAVNDAIDIMNN